MSKRSKACEIPQKVKEKVWNRAIVVALFVENMWTRVMQMLIL